MLDPHQLLLDGVLGAGTDQFAFKGYRLRGPEDPLLAVLGLTGCIIQGTAAVFGSILTKVA